MKSGIRSTEFWLSLAAVVLGALVASGLLVDAGGPWHKLGGVILSVLAALGYNSGRVRLKSGQAPDSNRKAAPDIFPPSTIAVLAIGAALALSVLSCAPTWDGKARQAIDGVATAAGRTNAMLSVACRPPLEKCKREGRRYDACHELQSCQDNRRLARQKLLALTQTLLVANSAVEEGDQSVAERAISAAQEALKQISGILAAMGVEL